MATLTDWVRALRADMVNLGATPTQAHRMLGVLLACRAETLRGGAA